MPNLGLGLRTTHNTKVTPAISYSNDFSMAFNGAGDSSLVPNSNLAFAIQISISVWVKPTAIDPGAGVIRTIFRKGPGSLANGFSLTQQRNGGAGQWQFHVHPNSTTQTIGVNVANTNWTHLFGTYNALNGTHILYVNGVDVANNIGSEYTPGGTLANAELIHIGAEAGAGTNEFAGSIDEAAIWSRLLTAGMAAQVYNLGTPGDLALGPQIAHNKGWWRMGEGATYSSGWFVPNAINPGVADAEGTGIAELDRTTDTP